jgi:hypothetical protein
MSDKIYAALSEDFIRRMRNWARAVTGQVTALRSTWSIEISGRRAGIDGPPLPILGGEASDVDAALRLLPHRYRWAVEEFWSREGRSLKQHARGREIDDTTMCEWIMRGHEQLKGIFAARRREWHAISQANARIANA